jgi:hypothetical protein
MAAQHLRRNPRRSASAKQLGSGKVVPVGGGEPGELLPGIAATGRRPCKGDPFAKRHPAGLSGSPFLRVPAHYGTVAATGPNCALCKKSRKTAQSCTTGHNYCAVTSARCACFNCELSAARSFIFRMVQACISLAASVRRVFTAAASCVVGATSASCT